MTKPPRERWNLAIAVALLVSLAIYCASSVRVANDLSVFLPVSTDDQTAELSRALALSEPSRIVVFTIDAEQTSEARDAAGSLVEALAKFSEIAWVEAGPGRDLAAETERLLFSRRYQLVDARPDAVTSSKRSDETLHIAAGRLKESLLTPLGPLVSRIADRDPLLVFPSLLTRLSGLRFGELAVEDGRYVTTDGRAAVVLCAMTAGVLDSARQRAAIVAIDDEVEALHGRFEGRVTIEYTGVGRFAVRSQELMLADATRIGVISTVAVLIVFVAVLGSLRLLLASLAVVAAGLLSGLAAVLVMYGQIHALTLGIGMTLIGVCGDYPVHYFQHWLSREEVVRPRVMMRKLWPALLLGATTTVVGFASLGLTSYAGLREVSLFAGTGVAGALSVTWLLLPAVAAPRPRFDGGRRLITYLSGWSASALTRTSVRCVTAIVVLAVMAVGCTWFALDRSLASLNQLDPTMVEVDARVRARVGTTHSGLVVVATEDNDEAALRLNDLVAARLSEHVAHDGLQGFASLHALVWSQELQRQNFEAIRADATLGRRTVDALEREGFRGEAFAPFLDELSTLRFDPLTLEDLRGTSLARLATSFRVPVGDKVGLLTLVPPGTDPAVLREALADLDGVVVFDQRRAIDDAYAGYQSELVRVIWVGILAVFLLTVVQYRGVARAAAVCAPAVVAILFTVCVLSIYGVALNMMHLVSLVLVFAMGVDYAIFLEQSRHEPSASAATLGSIWIAGTTTILGFGLLAMSEIPALRSIGQTTGLGIATSAVFALMMWPAVRTTRGTAGR